MTALRFPRAARLAVAMACAGAVGLPGLTPEARADVNPITGVPDAFTCRENKQTGQLVCEIRNPDTGCTFLYNSDGGVGILCPGPTRLKP